MWAVSVLGTPVPKPDPKCYGTGGFHRLSIPQAAKAYWAWRDRVIAAGVVLRSQAGGTLEGPVAIEVTVTIDRPKSAPKTRVWPAVRNGDADKIARAVLDALTEAELWGDDSQVVDLHTVKAYPCSPAADRLDEPGAIIRVWRPPNDYF